MSNFTEHIPAPCKEEIKVIHADDDIVVVVKPSGLLSVPGKFLKDCVVRRMMFDFPDVAVVHRLDLDTSGLMVLAQSRLAARELSQQFRARAVRKEYVAVVWGEMAHASGEIALPLSPDPDARPRHRVDLETGKEALTTYQVLTAGAGQSRVLLKPRTGRTHQLRVHLSHLGHPILGCDLYAHEAALAASPRLLLHASAISFRHPGTDAQVSFTDDPVF